MKNTMVIQSSVTDFPTSLSDEVVGEEYNGNPKFRNGFSHGDFINSILKKQHYKEVHEVLRVMEIVADYSDINGMSSIND